MIPMNRKKKINKILTRKLKKATGKTPQPAKKRYIAKADRVADSNAQIDNATPSQPASGAAIAEQVPPS